MKNSGKYQSLTIDPILKNFERGETANVKLSELAALIRVAKLVLASYSKVLRLKNH